MRPWLALVISLAFAFAYAATRNIYDDEVASFGTTMRPFAEIWRAANAGDIHPPGQYVLSSFFLNLMGSARSMTLGPLVFIYIGLTSFVAALLRNNTLVGSSRTLFAVVAFLHPQILMWGGSIRWQSYWTGLALIVLTLGLSLHREPEDEKLDLPSYPVLLTTGLLLAALLYINYLSFVLIGAFALAWAIRYPMSPASWARLAFTLAIAGLLFIPQIRPLVDVHMASAARQTPSGIGVFLKLLPGALVGQALMPWHPVAPLFGLTTLPFFFVLLGRARRHFFGHSGAARAIRLPSPTWLALLFMYLVVFAMALGTGLGGKPRSFVILSPIFAYLLAVAWQWTSSRALRRTAIVVVGLWIASSGYNLLAKVGTTKGGVNDRYDEVLAVAQEELSGRKTLFFTHDTSLAFALHDAAETLGEAWAVCGTADDYYHGSPCLPAIQDDRKVERVVLVTSFIGSFLTHQLSLNRAQQAVSDSIHIDRRAQVSWDRDAAMKRRIPGRKTQLCPDYRFTLYFGRPNPAVDFEALAEGYRNLTPDPP
ncbi:MAG: hypothetical protein JRG94_06685 [Deltaproteobacteria bacterium]|nr:hypothetical protein [Deltaproteobacteria bacterium]MBW2723704.1 hypothetical protein [Deltaproteobacteria bacterium]